MNTENYYEILEVSPKASIEVIKKAYIVLVKKYHPDSTTLSKAEATQKMVLLNKAYSILSNPTTRAEYDNSLKIHSNYTTQHAPTAEEIQQRNHIISLFKKLDTICTDILYQLKRDIQRSNGHEMSNQQVCDRLFSYFTQNAFPLLSELNVSSHKTHEVFKPVFLVYYHLGAAYTWTNNITQALKCLNESLTYISPSDKNYTAVSNAITNAQKLQQHKKENSIKGKLIMGIVAAIILFISYSIFTTPSTSTSTPKPTAAQSQAAKPVSNMKNAQPKQGVITGYTPNEPKLCTAGLSTLTIDNTQNDTPVYVRLWTADSSPRPVRTFTIAAKDKFTAENITAGRYEVRYKYLYENKNAEQGAKSEPFSLTQIEKDNGTEYDQLTLTLYKVRNGNTYMKNISATEV